MKARRLLHILEARNVKLRAEGDRLKWDAPKGIITDDIKARMRDQKTELLANVSRLMVTTKTMARRYQRKPN